MIDDDLINLFVSLIPDNAEKKILTLILSNENEKEEIIKQVCGITVEDRNDQV